MAARAKKTSAKKTQTVLTNTARSPEPAEFTKEEELQFYHDMLLIRRFEEKAGQLYGMGVIGGFCHLYIGQEAVVTGTVKAIKQGDQVITSYRDHGHMLATGMNPRGVMAELAGRKDGFSKGKGGSMHMFSKEKNFFGGHGIVGAQVPIGTGLAFSNKYLGRDNVTLVYFGDGAANQGQVYESFNISVTVRPIRGRFMKASIWLRFGNFLSFMLSKITNMPWERQFPVLLPRPIFRVAVCHLKFPVMLSMVWTFVL